MMDCVAPLLKSAPSDGAVSYFFEGPALRDVAEVFSRRTGRAAAEGGRSCAVVDRFISFVFDGRIQAN